MFRTNLVACVPAQWDEQHEAVVLCVETFEIFCCVSTVRMPAELHLLTYSRVRIPAGRKLSVAEWLKAMDFAQPCRTCTGAMG